MAVKSELEKLGLHHTRIELGETEILEELSAGQLDNLNTSLKKIGLELLDDKKNIMIENIKNIIIELVNYNEDQIKTNLSEYLGENSIITINPFLIFDEARFKPISKLSGGYNPCHIIIILPSYNYISTNRLTFLRS